MSDLDESHFPELPRPFSSTIDVDVFGLSDKGLVRKNNEDHYLVLRGARLLETVFSNLASRPGDRFEETMFGFVVADGVGGEAAGEVASQEAIIGLLNLALNTPDWQFKWGPIEMNTVKWRMQDRFRRVNTALVQQGLAHAGLKGMSTTMTAAVSHGDDLVVGHIGDSRAYLLREGKLKRLTRDHTVAERLMDEGQNPIDDRLLAELKDVLMQALGASETDCAPDINDYGLEDGDQLMLCTDGLTDMVDDSQIVEILLKGDTAQSACRKLLETALNNGGRDNITVIVARYSIPPG
jgi:serine/threonine protein phosphatase PrpC